MSMTEARRTEMHIGLRESLGPRVADSLMEHLPPNGWGDVARQSEMILRFEMIDRRFDEVDRRFDEVDRRFDEVDRRFEEIDRRFDGIDQRFEGVDGRFVGVDKRFDAIDARMRFMIGTILTIGLAMFGLQVQILLSLP
jgi:tetrahydromethanopterin S-methyltransferase subunit G